MARNFTSAEWEETSKRLDHQQTFARMRNTPYYRDAVYAQFSRAEYERRCRDAQAHNGKFYDVPKARIAEEVMYEMRK